MSKPKFGSLFIPGVAAELIYIALILIESMRDPRTGLIASLKRLSC
jgi:hypothetical protein